MIYVTNLDKPFDVELNLPGSKSITLRDMVLASLAGGCSFVRQPCVSDDINQMQEALTRFGLLVTNDSENTMTICDPNEWRRRKETVELYVGLSATSTRLLIALSTLRMGTTHIDAHVQMRGRPNKHLLDALIMLGATVTSLNDGYLPVQIVPSSQFMPRVTLRGNISSQYLSALLIIAPMIPSGLTIEIIRHLVSKPYIDITLNEMRKFGVSMENQDYKQFTFRPTAYRPSDVMVEGDASAASYWSALATLHGSTVILRNLGNRTCQGDYQFFNLCQRLGATVVSTEDSTTVTGPPGGILKPLKDPIDMESMPDVAPTLMALAPFIPGMVRIEGISTLRIKECDRISASARELRKLGVTVNEGPVFIEIHELTKKPSAPVELDTYHDHRMAMSLAVTSSKLGGVTILGSECVDKTYPLFWNDLGKIYGRSLTN